MSVDKSFLGQGWNFPPSFDAKTQTTKMVSNEEDIKQSLHLLLSTAPGERLMRPKFGCGIHTLVFETLSTTSISQMKDLIKIAVLEYEARINLLDVLVEKNIAEGYVSFQLEYIITSVNRRSNMVYPFYFIEGTQLPNPTPRT